MEGNSLFYLPDDLINDVGDQDELDRDKKGHRKRDSESLFDDPDRIGSLLAGVGLDLVPEPTTSLLTPADATVGEQHQPSFTFNIPSNNDSSPRNLLQIPRQDIAGNPSNAFHRQTIPSDLRATARSYVPPVIASPFSDTHDTEDRFSMRSRQIRRNSLPDPNAPGYFENSGALDLDGWGSMSNASDVGHSMLDSPDLPKHFERDIRFSTSGIGVFDSPTHASSPSSSSQPGHNTSPHGFSFNVDLPPSLESQQQSTWSVLGHKPVRPTTMGDQSLLGAFVSRMGIRGPRLGSEMSSEHLPHNAGAVGEGEDLRSPLRPRSSSSSEVDSPKWTARKQKLGGKLDWKTVLQNTPDTAQSQPIGQFPTRVRQQPAKLSPTSTVASKPHTKRLARAQHSKPHERPLPAPLQISTRSSAGKEKSRPADRAKGSKSSASGFQQPKKKTSKPDASSPASKREVAMDGHGGSRHVQQAPRRRSAKNPAQREVPRQSSRSATPRQPKSPQDGEKKMKPARNEEKKGWPAFAPPSSTQEEPRSSGTREVEMPWGEVRPEFRTGTQQQLERSRELENLRRKVEVAETTLLSSELGESDPGREVDEQGVGDNVKNSEQWESTTPNLTVKDEQGVQHEEYVVDALKERTTKSEDSPKELFTSEKKVPQNGRDMLKDVAATKTSREKQLRNTKRGTKATSKVRSNSREQLADTQRRVSQELKTSSPTSSKAKKTKKKSVLQQWKMRLEVSVLKPVQRQTMSVALYFANLFKNTLLFIGSWLLMVVNAVVQLHAVAFASMSTNHFVGMCYGSMYLFPLVVSTVIPWTPPWGPVCLWYAFLLQLLCSDDSKRAVVFRVIIPLGFLLEGVSHPTFLLHLKGAELLVGAFVLSSLRTLDHCSMLVVASFSVQVVLTSFAVEGTIQSAIIQWAVLLTGLLTLNAEAIYLSVLFSGRQGSAHIGKKRMQLGPF